MKYSVGLLLRNYSALFGGEVVSKVAGFLAFAYLARALEPTGYGIVELAVAISMIGMLIVDFGLGPVASRKLTTDPTTRFLLAGTIPAARLLLGVVGFAVMCGIGLSVTKSPEERVLILLFAIGMFTIPWTLNWLLQGLDQIPWVAPAQAIRMLTFLIGTLLLVQHPDHLVRVGGIELVSLGLVAGYFIAAAYSRTRLVTWPRFEKGSIRRILVEAAPVGFSQLLWVLNLYLPTVFIAGFLTVDDVAYYGASHRIVVSLGSFVFLYFFNLYPSLVRATETKTSAFEGIMNSSLWGTTWLVSLGALVVTVAATPICRLVYGEAFVPSGPLLLLLIWLLPINFISGHARFALIAAGHQMYALIAQAAGVVVTLILGFLLVPIQGAAGAAITIIVSAIVVWITAHVFACRSIRRFSFARPLARPIGAIMIALAVIHFKPVSDPWVQILVAGGIFALVGFLLELPNLKNLRPMMGSLAKLDEGRRSDDWS